MPPGLRSDSDEGPPPQAATQARRHLKSAPEASGETDAALARAEQAELAARRAHLDGDDDGPPRDGGSGMVSALADADEREIEGALRPKRLAEFTGQARVREQLSLILQSALRRGRPPDHVLLAGPPGLGKTTIAMIVAAELGAPLRITSGPAIERSGDLAAVLSTLSEGEVVFIDEIHRLARPAEEMLYLAMEDFRVDVVIGKGPGATAIPWTSRRSRWSGRPPGPACCPHRCGTGSGSPRTWTSTPPRSLSRSSAGPLACSG